MRVLFVCLGNICRSPAAEAVLRARRPDWHIDSAGTSGWHVGDPPYAPMKRVVEAAGFSMQGQQARAFEAADFERFDLILGMDADNVAAMTGLQSGTSPARLLQLTDYVEDADFVPDPYYTRDFEGALGLIRRCVDALIEAETGAKA